MHVGQEVKGGIFRDVVVTQGATIFKLLARKNQQILVWGDPFLVVDLGLDIPDGVRSFHFKSDGLTCEGLDKDLHTITIMFSEHEVEDGLILDVVVTQGTTIFEMCAGKDQALLVWGDSFRVLDLGLDILNCVRSYYFKSDSLACECLHKDLHTITQTEHQMKGVVFLDVVVTQGTTIFKLFASKNQALLVWVDPFLVLDLGLDILDGVTSFHFKRCSLACEGLDEYLHTIAINPEHEVKGGLILNVVVTQGATIFEMCAGKDQVLLVWGDSFLVLDLGFDIPDGVRSYHFKSDGPACEHLDKDLHTIPQAEHQVKGVVFLDVVVTQAMIIFKLLASKQQKLLVCGDSFLVLDFGLDISNGVGSYHFKNDGLACEGLDKDLHTITQPEHQVKGGRNSKLIQDIVVTQGTTIFKLFASKNQALLVWVEPFLVLDLGLDIADGVSTFHFKSDGPACECLDED